LSAVVYSELAEDDLVNIWLAIAADSEQTADRFIGELHDCARRLADQPLMGRVRPDLGEQTRSFPYGRYLLIYRPMNGGVGIARFAYGGRDIERLVIPGG